MHLTLPGLLLFPITMSEDTGKLPHLLYAMEA